MRGPYAIVKRARRIHVGLSMTQDLYDRMMKAVQSEAEPNRSQWLREAIEMKLGVRS